MSEQLYKFAFSFLQQETKAAARLLEELAPEDVAAFLSNAPQPLIAGVFTEMMPSACAEVLMQVDIGTAMLWLTELSNNHLCSVLRQLDKFKQNEILIQLPIKRRTACQLMLSYNSDMLGAWVETDVAAFPADMSAKEAIKRLKRKGYREDRIMFIVDGMRRPVGTLSMSVLLRSTNAISLESISKPCIDGINGTVTLSTAIGHPVWQSQDVVAVVNRRREFVGVIWYSQIRQLLSNPSSLLDANNEAVRDPALDMVHAFGESMRGLFDVVRKTIS